MEHRLQLLQESADLLCRNLAVLRESYPMEASPLREIGALLAACQSTSLTKEEVLAEHRRIRNSTLRLKRNVPDRHLLSTLLILPLEMRSVAAQEGIRRYLALKEAGFAEEYLFLINLWMAIRQVSGQASAEKTIRMREIFRSRHVGFPAGEEECYLQWLAALPEDAETLMERLEQHYDTLEQHIYSPMLRLCTAAVQTALGREDLPAEGGDAERLPMQLLGAEETLCLAAGQQLKAGKVFASVLQKKQRMRCAAALAACIPEEETKDLRRQVAESIMLTRQIILFTAK